MRCLLLYIQAEKHFHVTEPHSIDFPIWAFYTLILISKAEIQKILVPSRFQSIEKEPQL